jgi:hypothetical protein
LFQLYIILQFYKKDLFLLPAAGFVTLNAEIFKEVDAFNVLKPVIVKTDPVNVQVT